MKPFDIAAPKGYPHQALDTSTQQIRLIKLRPGKHDQPQCDIAVFELSSAPPFVAFSYTWGPPSPHFDLLINDEPIRIRENLFQFLQAYRATACNDYLWIDQICINQSNVRERNHQVGLMASIYSGCYETIIWLGYIHDNPGAPLLLKHPKRLMFPLEVKTHALEVKTHALEVTAPALASISRNNYFTRLWIVQEIILSNEIIVLCSHPFAGPVWVDWQDLCTDARQFLHHATSTAAKSLIKIHPQGIWMTLINAIRLFSESYCQDPRDKVYGLMGLVKQEQRLTIDYGKSLEGLLLDLVAIFYTESTQELSHSYAEYRDVLVDLARSWGIMSASLEAFLYDVWVKPIYNWHRQFGSKRPGPDIYPLIHSIGFLPEVLDQNVKLRRKELLPYSMSAGRELGFFEPIEWKPTKECWWYKIGGTTYQIYGLVSSRPLPSKSTMPGYYGRRIRRAHGEWKSRIHLPAWSASRSRIRSG
jgi:hypothetical protein